MPVAPAPMIATCSWPGRIGPGLRVGAHAGVDQAAVEALGLLGRVEHDGVLLDARRAEVVADAADGDDERVVAERSAPA